MRDHGNPPCAVRGDAHQLRRVVYNILNNAVKNATGGTVRVATHREDGEVVVSVSDIGDWYRTPDGLDATRRFGVLSRLDRKTSDRKGPPCV